MSQIYKQIEDIVLEEEHKFEINTLKELGLPRRDKKGNEVDGRGGAFERILTENGYMVYRNHSSTQDGSITYHIYKLVSVTTLKPKLDIQVEQLGHGEQA